MSDFPILPSVEIACRLEIRGEDSSSWVGVLIPPTDVQNALDGLRADLSSLLQRETRVLSLENGTFEELRAALHRPSNDIVILVVPIDLGAEKWSSVDLMRSALERTGPVILWVSANAFAGLSQFAPNIRSFIGPSIFAAGPEGGIMTDQQRNARLEELIGHYGYGNEEIVRKAESKELPPEPHFVEWLVLLGRGDLV